MNTNRNQWRNRRNQLNSSPMPPFGTMQYSISNYSTDAVKSDFTKTFGDEMLIHNNSFHMMPNPLQKNLADTILTGEKPPVPAFTETKTEKEPIHSRSDYYPSFTGISSFFSGVFSVLSGGMFHRRAKSPAPQYYDCFDRADESPPLDWQAAKREDLNKSARAGEQSPVGERGAMSDCGAAVAQCEDKLNRIRLLLATKPTSTTPKFRRRPRKAFVEPGSVEESFEDAFSPEDFVRLANEPYVECFSPYNHHKEELVEVEAPIIKTECVVVKIDIPTNKEADEVDAKLATKEIGVTSVTEPTADPEVEVIAVCEDKVNRLKELLQSRKPRRSIIEEKSTDSIAEPVLDKEDERASNRTKCIRNDKPQDKHSKKPRGSDKRKKSNVLKNIQDDMTFAHEIDADDVSSPDNSPLIKPTRLCDMINLCSKVAEVKPKLPEPEHKPNEYFDEVSGRFRSTSTTDSEDSFQIVFTDSPKANRARKVSDCDSEDSFIVFEDSPDSCYTSHDVFGEQSDSEVTDDSDTESDVSDSGCGVSCKLSGSFSRTVGNLADDSLFDDTVQQGSDSEDEVDSAVRTMCEEVPELDVDAQVSQKSTGLLIDDAKKLLRRHQPAKKVRFSEQPPRVLVMRVWAFAARAARAGHWERHALDRDRFKRKIADVDMAVSWVLKPQHRSRVMFQRFMPWWNAQRRKEIAEKKQKDEEERIERAEEERIENERAEEERKAKERDEEDRKAKIDKNLEEDSEVMYQNLVGQICAKYGKQYSKEDEVQMLGLTDRCVSEQVCARMRLPISVPEFERQLLDLARANLPHASEKPGADRLLQHLYEYKIPAALATNSTEQAVRLVTIARPKMFATFQHKVSVTDPEVDRGKPYPDIYLVAASRFKDKPKPAQCIVFEDSEVGVQAAVAAGMQVVMVPDPRLGRESTRQATLVLRSLRDFKPELFGLPPFNDPPPTNAVPIHHT